MPQVPVDPLILQIQAWEGILLCLFLGFLFGLMTNIKTGGGGRYFTVALAQIPYRFRELRVPLLPRCILGALLLALFPSCGDADFAAAHPLFVLAILVLASSVGLWLYGASRDLAAEEMHRKMEVEEFLANPDAAVPMPSRPPGEISATFHVWSKVNNFLFVLLVFRVIAPVLVFVWQNHHVALA